MFFALVNDIHRQALPRLRATCPLCRETVIAKCGEIISWHWSHQSGVDCDYWSEGMTQWHIDWQNRFPKSMREKIITRTEEIEPNDPRYETAKATINEKRRSIRESHRADIMMPDGTVIEFQHSAISTQSIAEREKFYGSQQIWVFDTVEAVEQDRLNLWAPKPHGDNDRFRRFQWSYPRRSITFCRHPIYLDVGDNQLLKIGNTSENALSGTGFIINYDEFVKQVGIDETYWEPNPDFIDASSAAEYARLVAILDDLPRCMHCHRPCTVPSVQHQKDGTPCHLSCCLLTTGKVGSEG